MRAAVPLALLAGALRGGLCEDLHSGLSFTIDERHGGLRNNPGLIVFIVLLSMVVCACGLCAIGFGKWDWLRVLVKGEDPTEVDLLGPPPPEPQGGGGNWVVRPRMETPLGDGGAGDGADAHSLRSGWGGGVGARGYDAAGDASRAEPQLPPDASPEAAAAWLLRVRGRPLAAPPAVASATPSGTASSGSSSWSEDVSAPSEPPRAADAPSSRRSSRRSRRTREAPAGSGGEGKPPPLPPDVAEARAFIAFAERRPMPASTASSGSSFWSRSGSGASAQGGGIGGLWSRLRGGGAQQPALAPTREERGASGERPDRERRRRSRSRRDADGRRLPPDERV